MASTAPAKSQPLHNFSLPHLKWTSNHQRPRSSSTSASRLSSPSPHRSPPFSHDSPLRQSPLRHSPLRGGGGDSTASPSLHSPMRVCEDSATPIQIRNSPMGHAGSDDSTAPPVSQSPIRVGVAGKSESTKPLIEYRRQSRHSVSNGVKDGVFISSADRNLKGGDSDNNKEGRSSKLLIKIRPKTSKVAAATEEIHVEEERKIEDNEVQEEEGKQHLLSVFDDEEPLPKTWNLRPRKPVKKSLNLNGSGFKNSGSGSTMPQQQQEKRAQSPMVNPNTSNKSEAQKKEKRKIGFRLSLSREEIEEDMFSFSGSKPPRRPKKRAKAVQNIIDNLFPGAWLQSITADSYKVNEHTAKG